MNSVNFRIVFDTASARDLRRLHRTQRNICKHIILNINSLSSHPFKGKPLKGTKKGCYSLRFNDYRIIYEIYPQRHMIHIIRIGHRRDVYR